MRYCQTCKAAFVELQRCPRDGTRLAEEGADPLVGEVLGDRYRILERISAGGMGQVYRAAHTRIASLCAVKVLFGEYAGEDDMRIRFEREAEAASILQSRYITRVTDFGETKSGLLYLVMELLDGISLASAISRAQFFDEDRAARIVRKIALGLAHAHERGIVHRDLKPQNVMLVTEDDEHDVPKILDFGIAQIRERPGVTLPGQVVGTPLYMAPEQFIAGGSAVDARTDLYALGLILYECVTGRSPFDGPTPNEIFVQHAKVPPAPFAVARPGYSPSRRFEDVVFKLLAKKPDDRFGSARALAEALEFKFDAAVEVTRKTVNPLPPASPLEVARDKIQRAIQWGAPLYNSGDAKGCADLYRKTAEQLIGGSLAPAHGAFRARLAIAVKRALGREPQQAAWELRYAFDDLLFVSGELKRRPSLTAARGDENRASPRFAPGCEQLGAIRQQLDLAALIAARQYEAGHLDVVCDFFLLLAQDVCAGLAAGGCEAVRKRLSEGVETAQQSSSRGEAAAILGEAFDEVRFDGESDAAPPAESAVLALSDQIEEVGAALVAAVRTGSRLYNSGDIDGCARLYLETAGRLVGTLQPGARNASLKRLLSVAIDKARASEANDSAWTMRHAFDAVLAAARISQTPLAVSAVKRER